MEYSKAKSVYYVVENDGKNNGEWLAIGSATKRSGINLQAQKMYFRPETRGLGIGGSNDS
jgi:hypothetical protein